MFSLRRQYNVMIVQWCMLFHPDHSLVVNLSHLNYRYMMMSGFIVSWFDTCAETIDSLAWLPLHPGLACRGVVTLKQCMLYASACWHALCLCMLTCSMPDMLDQQSSNPRWIYLNCMSLILCWSMLQLIICYMRWRENLSRVSLC